MDKIGITVFFEDPFWVGIFERLSDGELSVCKVTFGAEPRDCEVWEYILKHYYTLKFGTAVQTEVRNCADNPKRRQRAAKRLLKKSGIGTRSQQILKAQQEENKIEKRRKSKQQREAEAEYQYAVKQQKRKEKRKGH